MKVVDFLSLILPEEGFKFVLINYKKHIARLSIRDLAVVIEEEIAKGNTVHHANASFKHSEYINEKGEKKRRTKEDAIFAKSWWSDLDVDPNNPNKYSSIEEALATIERFCKETGLPLPLRVCSGNGVHIYWPVRDQVPMNEWNIVAATLRKLRSALGVSVDTSTDMDCARVLRPVGSYNRKDPNNPKLVYVIAENEAYPTKQEFMEMVLAAAKNILKPHQIDGHKSVNDTIANAIEEIDYPLADAKQIATHCKQMHDFMQTGGGNYQTWFLAAGVLKFCEDGKDIFIECSRKFPDYPGDIEAEAKWNEWSKKPTRCDTYANELGLCEGCKYLNKITTPWQLGVPIVQGSITASTEEKIKLPERYLENKSHQLCVQIENDDGVPIPIPFCDMLFYPIDRIVDIDGTTMYEFAQRVRKNDDNSWQWRIFRMPTGIIGSTTKLLEFLSKYEILPLAGGDKRMRPYVIASVDELRRRKEEIRSYKHMGWNDKKLIIGDKLYSPNEPPKKIILGGNLAPGYVNAFESSNGDYRDWVNAIDAAYNHPKHEQYQFIIAAGFASILIHMCNVNTGAIIHLYGKKGRGKTTVCKLATSVWGHPDRMMISDPKQGITNNALFARISATNAFPFLIDEVNGLTGAEASALSYSLANAVSKEVLDKTRKRVEPLPAYSNINFTTGNSSFHDNLSASYADASAQLSRVLEIEMWDDINTISNSEMDAIYDNIKTKCYGTVGPIFAQFVVDNYDVVKNLVWKVKSELESKYGLTKDYRFWAVQLSCIITAAVIGKKLGLFPFSVSSIKDLSYSLAAKGTANIIEHVQTPIEAFHHMITSQSNHIINTSSLGENGREEVRIIGEPIGRVIRDFGELYITVQSVREWCVKRNVNFNALKAELLETGLLLNTDSRFYLGKGTTLATGQSRCWKIDWDKLSGIELSDKPRLTKIVG